MQNNLISLTEKIRIKTEQEQQEVETLIKKIYQNLHESLNKLSSDALHTTETAIQNNLILWEKSIQKNCITAQNLLSHHYHKTVVWSISIVLITSICIAMLIGISHFQISSLQAKIQSLEEQTKSVESEYIKVWQTFKGLEKYYYQGENYLLTPQNWQITLYGTKGNQNVWQIQKP